LRKLFRREPERQSFDWYLQQYAQWSTGGNTYVQPFQTTIPGEKAASIPNTFNDYAEGGYKGNGVIFGLASVRMRVFSEARFQYQEMRKGRPGDLFGTADLALLEQPWPGGTTGDLLSAMILRADFAGNAFVVRSGGRLVVLRPDWVQIMLADLYHSDGVQEGAIAYETVGYAYYHGGVTAQKRPTVFLPHEVAHFMPQPDPTANYNVGMSWLTPVIREIQADGAATSHKLKFFENAATPNLAVSLPKEITPQQFREFVDLMDEKHKGATNAYKTLYTAGGADVTVIGADMHQIDFKVTQGAGETRLAQAAGVPPVVAGLSEGLQGSSLNAGNFGQARRQFADTTLSNLWRNCAGSLETLFPAPGAARLWYDSRDIPFLREDQKDAAEIQSIQATAISSLIMSGYTPESVVASVIADDMKLLVHTGLFSVQLQEPGAPQEPVAKPVEKPAAEQPALPGI
jgi:phage portal protein BeeE